MKKLFLMGFVALAFASCVSDKDVTPQTQDQKYQAAFEELVGGKVNANVNWGFNAMQTITFDAEGKYAGMRAANTENNRWGMYMVVPTEMTAEQKAKVKKYFDNVKQPEGIAINWSDFFVHQVSQTVKGKNMDYLYCGEKDYEAKDHVNNFNGGSSTDKKNVGVEPRDANNAREVDYYDGIMYMYNSGTEFFAFHNSYDDTYYEDNYVIVSGEMIDAAYPEAPSVAGMYFVGFDYEHDKTKMNEDDVEARDYYFNDWVIRVSPGYFRNSKRVMVEDLIASDLSNVGFTADKSDWDFNDAVFDVAYKADGNKQYAIITLWAAGGTKALTVGGKEVHELFGQSTKTMINTNATGGVDGLTPVIFRVDMGTMDYNKTYTADEVKVYVGSTELKAETGKAPQKVVVSNTTRWMKEMKIITSGYASFANYATNGTPTEWYETVTNSSVLY
jgi:hypothetical protein